MDNQLSWEAKNAIMKKRILKWYNLCEEVDTGARVYKYVKKNQPYILMFMPGMNAPVSICVGNSKNCPCWTWNDDIYYPTFRPSIKTDYGTVDTPRCNHVLIKDGIVKYLPDCTHEYVGKTLQLPTIGEWGAQFDILSE